MSVNFNVDKAASQEMSVALNQGAILNGTNLVSKDKETDKILRSRSLQEMTASEIVDKSSNKKFAAEVFKPFFNKLAEVGITVGTQRQAQRAKDEVAKLFGEGESFEDLVEIKSRPEFIKQIGKTGQQNSDGSGSAFSNQSSQEEVMAMIKDLVGALTDYAVTQTPELAKKIRHLKDQLMQKGVSESKLNALEAKVNSGNKVDLTEILKESLVMQMLSADSIIDRTVYKKQISDLLKGLDPEIAKEVLVEAKEKAASEMRGFSVEEMENALIKLTYTQSDDHEHVYNLIKVADEAGVNYVDWMQNIWEEKKVHHGLNLFDIPPGVTGQNVDTNSDQQHQQKHGYEFEAKDEQEILVNRLRAQYMQQALKGDAMTYIATEFKIRKLKNGLVKLGIFTKDLEDRVRHEAEVVAKIKIIEMLKEALVERASFYELAGPAFLLVEKKIKGLLKNAERLGMPISGTEFINLRDKANRKVFDLSIRELTDVRSQLAGKYSAKLEKKETLLIRLLARLKEESKIEVAIPSAC